MGGPLSDLWTGLNVEAAEWIRQTRAKGERPVGRSQGSDHALKSIYVLAQADYDSFEVVAAFTTRELAEAFVERYDAQARSQHRPLLDADVYEYPLDPSTMGEVWAR